MQKLKNDIRRELLKSAEELFLRKGFQKTSMREIAETAQVGLGNIYNYFSSKDDLFCSIVYPVTHAFECGCWKSITGITGPMWWRYWARFIFGRRLTSISCWSSLSGIDDLVVCPGLRDIPCEFPGKFYRSFHWVGERVVFGNEIQVSVLNVTVSDFFIHLHSVWMFTLFEEIIMHKIEDQEIEQIVAEYVKFEITGWRDILKI